MFLESLAEATIMPVNFRGTRHIVAPVYALNGIDSQGREKRKGARVK